MAARGGQASPNAALVRILSWQYASHNKLRLFSHCWGPKNLLSSSLINFLVDRLDLDGLLFHRNDDCIPSCLQDVFQWDRNPGGALIEALSSPVPAADRVDGLQQTSKGQANDFATQNLMGPADHTQDTCFRSLLAGEHPLAAR